MFKGGSNTGGGKGTTHPGAGNRASLGRGGEGLGRKEVEISLQGRVAGRVWVQAYVLGLS